MEQEKIANRIVEAIDKLTKEVRRLREVIEPWDEVPSIDDDNLDKYIL